MKKGDLVLVPFPFTDLKGAKKRPALVLLSDQTDVTVAFITSRFKWASDFDISLKPSIENGLKEESLIRLSKLATIEKDLVIGLLGELSQDEILQINTNLIRLFNLNF